MNRIEIELFDKVLERYPNLSHSQRVGLRGEITAYSKLKSGLRRMFPYPFRVPKVVYNPVKTFFSSKPDIILELGKVRVLIEVKSWRFRVTPDDVYSFIRCKDWDETGKTIKVFLNVQANRVSKEVLGALKRLGIVYSNGIDRLLNSLNEGGLCTTTPLPMHSRLPLLGDSIIFGKGDERSYRTVISGNRGLSVLDERQPPTSAGINSRGALDALRRLRQQAPKPFYW
jgi:hypothetical protein